jgi:N12 class adenine-specific DNA methylase
MPSWPDKLRLKALAEEDIYFAKRDRELIKALHRRRLAKHLNVDTKKAKKKAKTLQKAYADVTVSHKDRPKRLAKFYRGLITKALGLVSRRGH